MTELFDETEPYDSGMLAVGDGHAVYYEQVGNPRGVPALVLHGGPGSGAAPGWRRWFDPAVYRAVLFDQRGCGRSTPSAAEPDADLSVNTLPHLLADIERLRAHLGVERWLLFGGSWGATLGLAYAQQHAAAVSAVVLFSVTTTTAGEVHWITREMGRVFPEAWEQFRDAVPPAERDGSLVDAYARLLADADPAVRDAAARAWCAWEDTHVSILGPVEPDERYADPDFRLAFARLVTHYWRHAAWRAPGELRDGAARLAGVPGVLVTGRADVSSPPVIAWEVARAWGPAVRLHIVDGAAHGSGGMGDILRSALSRFGTELSS
ncbi:prolyl aminopeptidase [Spirilliplanes yamanashiensis]|uniref:Proline iminopeptidase n=1 Tax=Spirilliplanes yamanashiensis TaxID=42233 RepID=A0A8J4DK03_9ACTN|nr:prolyl aminopeptidase [Spirilliplanes yamanashiensis]MDP9817928.1 proline iminopeptidase [Spirilliplanes yamanashiensis]GIJ04737.1 proline iminopeptidase [Spirilliplanes yamanashiensis]